MSTDISTRAINLFEQKVTDKRKTYKNTAYYITPNPNITGYIKKLNIQNEQDIFSKYVHKLFLK